MSKTTTLLYIAEESVTVSYTTTACYKGSQTDPPENEWNQIEKVIWRGLNITKVITEEEFLNLYSQIYENHQA